MDVCCSQYYHIFLTCLNSTEIGYAPVWMKGLGRHIQLITNNEDQNCICLMHELTGSGSSYCTYTQTCILANIDSEALLILPDFFSWFPNFLLAPDNENLLALPLPGISWAHGSSHLLQILVSDVISESPYIEAQRVRSALQ